MPWRPCVINGADDHRRVRPGCCLPRDRPASRTVTGVLALPCLQGHDLNDRIAGRTAVLAGSHEQRRAHAVQSVTPMTDDEKEQPLVGGAVTLRDMGGGRTPVIMDDAKSTPPCRETWWSFEFFYIHQDFEAAAVDSMQ